MARYALLELDEEERETLNALLGWLLDEDHASIEPGWLDDHIGGEGSAAIVERIAGRLATLTHGKGNENG